MTNKCKECGCMCKLCFGSNDHDVHLHVEIENLKQKLVERENHIVTMETNFLNEANKFPNGELMALREELLVWQDKYRRLYESHRRVQRVNQGLEDKLLKLVDTCESDKGTLTKDVAILSQKLAEANYAIKKLTQDNERYKSDVSLAIQFLQCKQSNFVARKYDSLPVEVQNQISTYIRRKPEKPEVKSIKVPIPTFPPTAMVYSIHKTTTTTQVLDDSDTQTMQQQEQQPSVDIVSAAIMAKVLEERQKERAYAKHCDTCTCSKKLSIIYDIKHCTIGTQTNNDTKCCNQQQQPAILQNQEKNVAQVLPNNFLTDTVDNNETIEESKSNLHHHLCSKIVLPYEKDKQNAKSLINDLKGPRYCSVKLETDTRNILLDNVHNNIAPVLYTRNHHHNQHHHHHHQKMKDTPKLHEQYYSPHSYTDPNDNPIDNETGNNQNDPQFDDEEKKRLAQMEENVKRFLFGESGLLKTDKLVTLNGGDEGNCTN